MVRWYDRRMLVGNNKEVYEKLWNRSPVKVVYKHPDRMPDRAAGYFALTVEGRDNPQIWIARYPVPMESWKGKADLEAATISELITLAHEPSLPT